MTSQRSRLHWLALCGAVAFGAGCMSWRAETVSPDQLITQSHPDEVRVTLSDRSKVELQNPTLAGDTLVGHRDARPMTGSPFTADPLGVAPAPGEAAGGTELRIPVAEVVRIETLHRSLVSPDPLVRAASAVAVGVLIGLVAIACCQN